jgi:hypothetical protein
MAAHSSLTPEISGENYRFSLLWEMCVEIGSDIQVMLAGNDGFATH